MILAVTLRLVGEITIHDNLYPTMKNKVIFAAVCNPGYIKLRITQFKTRAHSNKFIYL